MDSDGDVSTSSEKSFYVEVKVKDGSEVLATTGAVKVTVAPELEVSSFEGIHLGDLNASTEVADYEDLKASNDVVTSLKVNATGKTLNLFAKDVEGNIVLLSPIEDDASTTTVDETNFKITNLTPSCQCNC
ncbi:hypothetical protein [Fictibacillus sp. KU28468]|uniref:hypothetical protein n=1 Tax=Fictibacillus sp. KU28468 TaxID=2991053 RepID=UPI00223D43CB|nr:hypothetical protein [Fictibacillus sp. KU28468]UZJ79575.1 hypothetical protein OKX00_03580 [Fictibacillus sp. KU28468]